MAGLAFVPQTGSKQDDPKARKLIRRQVMLGKNQGRTVTRRRPDIDAARILTRTNWQAPTLDIAPSITQRVGSDLSLLRFADIVDPSLMSETLQFCSASARNLFVLEQCISFDPRETIHACFHGLASDALYLNVMVFSTQEYMNSLRATTTWPERSCRDSGAQHYGKALRLLRQRLDDAEKLPSAIADITIMAVMPLVMHALITGELSTARNHVVELSKIVQMRDGGLSFFSMRTKQSIELLR